MRNLPTLHYEDLNENNPLRIYRLHADDSLAFCYSTRHEKKSFEVLWLQEGSGIHVVDEMHFPFCDNTVFCGSPGQIHQLISNSSFTGYVIAFNESFFRLGKVDEKGVYDSEFFTLFSQSSAVPLEKEIAEELNDVALKMTKEATGNRSLKVEFLRRYLKIFLLYVLRQFELQQPGSIQNSDGLVKRFFLALGRDFKKKKLVTEYADSLAVSANYLNQMVKRITGNSAGYHIRQRIIAEAKRKAIYSNWNMKEIAYDLGFDTASHFSKFFKNYGGTNFSSFKRSEEVYSLAHYSQL